MSFPYSSLPSFPQSYSIYRQSWYLMAVQAGVHYRFQSKAPLKSWVSTSQAHSQVKTPSLVCHLPQFLPKSPEFRAWSSCGQSDRVHRCLSQLQNTLSSCVPPRFLVLSLVLICVIAFHFFIFRESPAASDQAGNLKTLCCILRGGLPARKSGLPKLRSHRCCRKF